MKERNKFKILTDDLKENLFGKILIREAMKKNPIRKALKNLNAVFRKNIKSAKKRLSKIF